MSWISRITSIGVIVFASVLTFDIIAYFALADLVGRIQPVFGRDVVIDSFSRGYPRYHFKNHPERSFDIAPGVEAVAYRPIEAPGYKVWGNDLGCFDRMREKGFVPDIYLAGDSFTWGYSPFELQFGKLLEEHLDRDVLKCGVTHTGQRHQFSKFLDVFRQLGTFPKVVVVNYVENDLANDFAYPHTVVIDGYQVENTQLRVTQDGIGVYRIARSELQIEFDARRSQSGPTKVGRIKYLLRKYSATTNILNRIVEVTVSSLRPMVISNGIGGGEKKKAEVNPVGQTEKGGFYPIYTLADHIGASETLQINSAEAAPHRVVLQQWIAHSRENGYRLVFALIPRQNRVGQGYFKELEVFLNAFKAEWYNFENYLINQKIEPNTLYWKYDEHFNYTGNAVYSRFLQKIIQYN